MNYLNLTNNIFNYEIFFFILVIILIIETNCKTIVIPFNIIELPGEEKQSYIYTNIEIGTPPQKIDSIINFQNSLFYFSNISPLNISFNSTYNYSESSSFEIISDINISSSEYKNIISEQIYFYTDINCQNKSKYNISPILYPDIHSNESLFITIDLQINNNSMNKSFNIINILKERKIINSYFWTIKLDNNLTTGKIIIGDLPHNYDKDNYIEKNLKWINTYSKENKIFWGIQFSSIKFWNKTISDIMIGKIEPKILEIFGSNEYIEAIEEIFFDEYKKKDICKRTFDKVLGEDVHRFICDKGKFNKSDIDLFPNLTLVNNELNYSFILTGNELFMEKDNNISFMIVSKVESPIKEWELGRIFLNKYQFVMDNENNLIGIYKKENNDNKSKKQNKNMLIVIISILSLNMLIAIGVIIYYIQKNVCKNRKQSLSELDDDYLYQIKEKE